MSGASSTGSQGIQARLKAEEIMAEVEGMKRAREANEVAGNIVVELKDTETKVEK